MDPSREVDFNFDLARVKVEPKQDRRVKQEPKAEQESPDKCAICWTDPPTNAIRLDCGHIFCFLCIKSVAIATKRCALCRAEIEKDFDFGEFDLVGKAKLPAGSEDGYFWFYEGRTGWWLYDADTSRDIEEAYKNGKKRIDKLISGHVYVINLHSLRQYQKSDQSRSRFICRETLDLENILGVAGIRNKTILERMKLCRQRQHEAELNPTRINDLRF